MTGEVRPGLMEFAGVVVKQESLGRIATTRLQRWASQNLCSPRPAQPGSGRDGPGRAGALGLRLQVTRPRPFLKRERSGVLSGIAVRGPLVAFCSARPNAAAGRRRWLGDLLSPFAGAGPLSSPEGGRRPRLRARQQRRWPTSLCRRLFGVFMFGLGAGVDESEPCTAKM